MRETITTFFSLNKTINNSFLIFIIISIKVISNTFNPIQALPIINVQDLKKESEILSSTPNSNLTKAILKLDSWEVTTLNNINNRYDCLPEELLFNSSTTSIDRNYFTYLLHLCLQNIVHQNKSLEAEAISKIKQLQQNFPVSSTPLSSNIEHGENRVDDLKTANSGTNLSLEGEAIIALIGVEQKGTPTANFALGTRVRLNFITSFSDRDELQIRLQGRSIPELEEVTGSKMANLGFDGQDEGDVEIDEIEYKYALNDNSTLRVYFLGAGLGDLIPTVNDLYSSSGKGAISTFGRENPLRRLVEGGGISWSQNWGDNLNFTVGYVDEGSNRSDRGLFQDSYGLISQLTFANNQRLSWSLTYGYTKNKIGTGTGSAIAENPFGDVDNTFAHSYGGELSYWLQPKL